jgi:hypothetical protein
MKNFRYFSCFTGLVLLVAGCGSSQQEQELFNPLSSEISGIDFKNDLNYNKQLNPYTFKNFYNGGGVAVGDLNNDDLPEIFFCGNMVSNKLYLNQGDLKFQDITDKANLDSQGSWSTGVSLVDINADGFLDIYVCKSGAPEGPDRHNQLYINNGDLTFTEQAESYGLDILGLSVQAAFFDYDKDGDLDCYLLNNSITSIGSFDVIAGLRSIPDSLGGNMLLRNDNGYFNDVTLSSGIYSSKIGFGLGATVGDINQDNWPDIYISNDFFEKDYLYINQGDGTFLEQLEVYIKETSMGSMGADLADINNDGFPEYFVTEMLPERRDRLVTKAFFQSWREQQNAQNKGYHNQFGRNVLQLNNQDGTFSEIGRYAGVEATDWSWASLIFDADNDGKKDLFVSNGIYKDLLDLDYLNFMSDASRVSNILQSDEKSIVTIIDMMPSEPLPNYIFQNNGDLTFTNKALEWGMQAPTFSNGSAYGDLDNDGDLDLVVNNVNMPSMIYENRTSQLFPEHNYLALNLNGAGLNTMAIGTRIKVYANHEIIYQELNPTRGFESSVDYKLIFGLGNTEKIDSILINWPNGGITSLLNVNSNQTLDLDENNAAPYTPPVKQQIKPLFTEYVNQSLVFNHVENDYVDFHKERLLFHMNSTEGPCICKGDINDDGKDDLYLGGASGQPGRIFIQSDDGEFDSSHDSFLKERESEDLDCVFSDINGDGFLDLYVTSGGSEFSSISPWLNDRLYLGDGSGGLVKTEQKLPNKGYEASSVVVPLDFDQDGDMDLFVGGRLTPSYYGVPPNSYLLENNGTGSLTVALVSAGMLDRLGMVTDATLADLDGDGGNELVIVGRWMPIKVFKFSNGTMTDVSSSWIPEKSHGWYNTVEAADLNNDGMIDLVVGNHGLNSRFKASNGEPIELLVQDFDNSGTYEQIVSMYFGGRQYPFIQLKELASQLPQIAQQYRSFNEYKHHETTALFPEEIQKKGFVLKTYNLASGIFINQGRELRFKKLPMRGQLSPIYAIKITDFDNDGFTDIIMGGNFIQSKPEVGSYNAGFGALFKGSEDGSLTFVPNAEAGFHVDGAVRDIEDIRIEEKNVLIFTRNNNSIYSIEYARQK